MSTEQTVRTEQTQNAERRGFFSKFAMVIGIVGGYGMFAWIASKFLYPAKFEDKAWLYVTETKKLKVGDSLLFRSPTGETVNVTRQAENDTSEDFIALSSVCPHLGCQVTWQSQNNQYFCPCHNGTFDAQGIGTGGPPGDAGQSLPRFPLKVEGNLLFIETKVNGLTAENKFEQIQRADIAGPGHDPCLSRLAQIKRTQNS